MVWPKGFCFRCRCWIRGVSFIAMIVLLGSSLNAKPVIELHPNAHKPSKISLRSDNVELVFLP